MKIQALETTFLSDPNLSKFQDNLINFSNQLMPLLFLKGNLISAAALGTSPVKIAHKLGVTPLGYLILEQNANAVIYITSKDKDFITFQASATVVANIWIF